MFDKILIANRGEIACRVMRTCDRLGVSTVAVYSDADAKALHVLSAQESVHIGASPPSESYLRGEKIIAAALSSGAQAIHPGYGFLSENADFARRCESSGLVFIGPTPESIEQMGSKATAKQIMAAAGVPVVPGYHGANQDDELLAAEAEKMGFPLLIKAVAGGGGKGMRLVSGSLEFQAQLAAARREAKSAFADDRVLLELYLAEPHHIEFQVFGDARGNVVHLFERECSIQRRHQKILEESPSPFLSDDLRRRMGDAAVAAAAAIQYRGAGTIEFIVGADHKFYFMEMNTRLQVEHPVTEALTGLDVVEWQLRIACGEALPLAQGEIERNGHAIEVRLCAEDPQRQFFPEAGPVHQFIYPKAATPHSECGVRVDTGVQSGDNIGVFYDPLLAKLIVNGPDRAAAVNALTTALARTAVLGVTTNIDFLSRVVRHPHFAAGLTTTHFIDQHQHDLLAQEPRAPNLALAFAAARVLADEAARAEAATAASADPGSPWADISGWRLNAPPRRSVLLADRLAGASVEIGVTGSAQCFTLTLPEGPLALRRPSNLDQESFGEATHLCRLELDGRIREAIVLKHETRILLLLDGKRYAFEQTYPFAFEAAAEVAGGRLTALMPGRIVQLLVGPGDQVQQGQPLLIMEAMKMEHTIHSPRDGRIETVMYPVDCVVEADAVLFAFAEPVQN